MKFSSESLVGRDLRRAGWHEWFAWYPVRTDDNTICWLEYVVRRGDWRWVRYGQSEYLQFVWEYRDNAGDVPQVHNPCAPPPQSRQK
nr:MAG TPA: hypothetical protein [Caudoviricetes sp.]